MATTITRAETLVGKRVRRREDPRLITGTACYLDDIKIPGMHHACIVRSPHAAARIKGIASQAASELPGVVAIFTGADIAKLGPVPCAASLPGLRVPHHHLLAQDRVYYVGHPIAVVVATDRYIARDAADLVMVDYDELPVVTDVEQAASGGPKKNRDNLIRSARLRLSTSSFERRSGVALSLKHFGRKHHGQKTGATI